jgi:6-phosphogluconolactonase
VTMRRLCNLLSLALTSSTCLFSQAVYVVNAGSNSVSAYTINGSTGALTTVPGSPFATGRNPHAVAVDPSGKFVYVVNLGDVSPGNIAAYTANPSNISAYTVSPSNGALTAVPGSPFPVMAFPAPSTFFFNILNEVGLAVDPSGKFVYVTYTNSNNSVMAYAINAGNGALTAVPGSPFPTGSNPQVLAVHPSGKFLYVAGASIGTFQELVSVFSIDAGSGALVTIPGSPFKTVQGGSQAAIDPAGKFLYLMGEDSNLQVYTIDIGAYAINSGTGALSAAAGRPVVPMGLAQGFAVDPTGKFAFATALFPDTVSAYAINAGSGTWTAVPGSPFAGIPSGEGKVSLRNKLCRD